MQQGATGSSREQQGTLTPVHPSSHHSYRRLQVLRGSQWPVLNSVPYLADKAGESVKHHALVFSAVRERSNHSDLPLSTGGRNC